MRRFNIMQSPTQWEETLGQRARGDRHHHAERPQWGQPPAQVKSQGKLQSTRRPRGEPRPARLRRDCVKSNPERLINGPVAPLILRRRGSGADRKRLTASQTARSSARGAEPDSRDEWTASPGLETLPGVSSEIAQTVRAPRGGRMATEAR